MRCAWHRWVKILSLANPIFFLQMFSLKKDMFTPKRISPDCPFKSKKRLAMILILTLRCYANCVTWLRGGMHTGDKLSSRMGAQAKRPKGQNIPRQIVPRHKVPGTKYPKKQNVPRAKRPKGQIFPRDKTSYTNTKFSKAHFVSVNWPHILC